MAKLKYLFLFMLFGMSSLFANCIESGVNPYVLHDYDFEVPEKIKEALDITTESNLLIFNILLIQTPIEDSYINFVEPLVFNTDTKKAAQIILADNAQYQVAERISSFLNK